MQIFGCAKNRVPFLSVGFVALGLLVLGIASCKAPERRNQSKVSKENLGWPKGALRFREANLGVLKVDLPQVTGAEFVNDNELCMTCHEAYAKAHITNVHRNQNCESCHGPGSRHLETRGKEPGLIFSFKTAPAAQRSEACLKCHENAHGPGDTWRTSVHAHKGVTCTDCHTSHYNVPAGTPPTQVASLSDPKSDVTLASAVLRAQEPPDPQTISLAGTSNHLNAVAPQVCYKCHAEKRDLEEIAHPHQVCGKNGLNCTTCHNPHGNISQQTRKDLCLECHKGSPTMAWHSSTHDQFGVACADCHKPHPSSTVPEIVAINHNSVGRPKRMPMSVDQPETCYKCHPAIFAKNSMPEHHPIKEGKMVCSDCHDPHGQARGNLREAGTVNQVCYRCHADKQGPFAYEHPPVTENCMICHEPHGTVANNLLRQPATFLCLRCHTGHRTSPLGPNHSPLLGDVGTSPALQRAFFTNCTQCHSQIHGSDLPSAHLPHAWMR